jgi:hypothetical protein
MQAKQRISASAAERPAISAVNGPATIEFRCGATSRDGISQATDWESEECRSYGKLVAPAYQRDIYK